MNQEKLKILAVEDNPADFRLLQEYLKEGFPSGFELVHAKTLREALAVSTAEKFDIILSDMGLPDSTGLDSLEKLYSHNPSVPIIVLTGFGDEDVGVRALKKNAQDYLVKGEINPNILIKSIRYSIQRKLGEGKLQKLNRTLKALSASTRAMMHAVNEQNYLQEVCRNVVRDCGYKLVWIGFAEDDEFKSVRPVAQAGFEEGYLGTLNISWADNERGRGPTGTAIRTKKPCICANMLTDKNFLPWRKEAVARGYASSVVLPLIIDATAFGAISIYSEESDSFDEEEIELLLELANDLSSGISSIKLRKRNKQAEEALQKAHDELEGRVDERTRELINEIKEHTLAKQALQHNVAELKATEKKIRTSNALLKLLGASAPRKRYLESVIKLIRGISGCRCAGIRVLGEGGLIPYESYVGFSRKFWNSENSLCLDKDQCICVRAVKGNPEPQDKPLVSKNGSFFSNNTHSFINSLSEEERSRFRGVCMLNGFVSLAVIPVSYKEQCSAAIHLADEREGMVPLKTIEFIESLAPLVGEAINKFNLEDKIRQEQTELLKAQKELADARRLSDIGTLSATVAHELRNPLAAIRMAAYNLKRKTQNPDLEKHFINIEKKVAESDQIINNLLFYSRLKQPHYELVSLADILNECVDAAKKRYSKHAVKAYKKYRAIENISVEADPLQIKEVFSNLLNNAYDALTGDKGLIEIKAEFEGDRHIKVLFKDNGIGIDEEHLKEIFEPFFTTKAKGTGLGLTVCSQIVQLHNGNICLESKKGQGTTVAVTLPISKS